MVLTVTMTPVAFRSFITARPVDEEMLKDEVRTRTYEMAIMQNKHVFKDKVSGIFDIACMNSPTKSPTDFVNYRLFWM